LDLFDVARSCGRRWYVFLPLLLIVVWFSYSAYSSVKPVYYSNAVVGLTPPSTRIDNVPPGVPLPRNGLLDVGGASFVANMTALGLRQPTVIDRVVAAGGLPDYTARMFPVPATMPQLPLIMIEVTDADPTEVSKTLELVVHEADGTLRSLQQQAQVPDDQMVTPFVVSPPSAPAAGTPSRTRSTIAIFVAGAGLAVVVTILADVLLTRRKARRRQLPPTGADVQPVPADVGPNGQHPAPTASPTEGARETR
jgi:hypothetical protein